MINASAVHKQNNTEAFKAAHTAEELEKFVRRKAHEEDTGHALQEVRAEHARVQKKSERKEASRKACKAKRTARDNVLEQLKIHLEPAFWDNSTAARQPTVKDISLQLSWLRVPSRGVKVPAGLSKARRTELVRALMEVLQGLDEDKVKLLYAQNVAERERAVLLLSTDVEMARRITSHEIRQIIQNALDNANNNLPTESLSSLSEADARVVLDEMWRVLDSPASPSAAIGGLPFAVYRTTLRKLTLKLALRHHILPDSLILTGVKKLDDVQRGAGAFSDVYCGTYRGRKVALKKLRVFLMTPEWKKGDITTAFYRESLIWKSLENENIMPFLGVSEDIFPGTLCMVLLWAESGSLRDHLASIRKKGQLNDDSFAVAIHKWLYQTALGMEYLHNEGIVHGDLHAGNILLNKHGNACLTDFGMSLITEGTGYNYGSMHGGGAIRWQAPELIDPEAFGLEGTRPTTQSDVFSIACTAIELYSGLPPLPDLTDRQVTNRYIQGVRPPRPCLPGGREMADETWLVLEACWAQNREDRISVHEVNARLGDILQMAVSAEQLIAGMGALDVQGPGFSLVSLAAAYDDDPKIAAAARNLGVYLIKILALARCMIIAMPDLDSMTDAQRTAFLVSGDCQAAAVLAVILAQHAKKAREAHEVYKSVRCIGLPMFWPKPYRLVVDNLEQDIERLALPPLAVTDFELVTTFYTRVEPATHVYLAWLGMMLAKQKEAQ
ncbi:hypothetical protein EUX98_g7058 [Antrodiella citrinella]|uniref:Protein kinase domain-containing protein n=1 Tax=Antrodiella citrinella TaxID=2447956 RepID=A0A4S4MMI0_9APHY|nr:hypothetical protein EUX98_g7058 [Antrodiella citrinella]